jgi:hypothetical protein
MSETIGASAQNPETDVSNTDAISALMRAEIKPEPVKTNPETEAQFAEAKLKPEKFKVNDVVLAKRHLSAVMQRDEGDHAATILMDLATVFDEADVNHDGKLTFEEWHDKCGKWLEEEQLRKIFMECDTNGVGILDIQEFTKGCENKYLIKWAQVVLIATRRCVILIWHQWPGLGGTPADRISTQCTWAGTTSGKRQGRHGRFALL